VAISLLLLGIHTRRDRHVALLLAMTDSQADRYDSQDLCDRLSHEPANWWDWLKWGLLLRCLGRLLRYDV